MPPGALLAWRCVWLGSSPVGRGFFKGSVVSGCLAARTWYTIRFRDGFGKQREEAGKALTAAEDIALEIVISVC